ncbi:MarR family winged helix-turn-helix transcriptional regulator [Stackebrandtia soli]|uniref:MarR family winged helix-turn-helix transcriptional regulator n=1 Tax=Stackebrandtia soli TaxID=1892856 RepID=UPI0039E7D1AE
MTTPRWLTDDEQATWRAYLWSTQLFHEALDRQLQHDSGMPHAYYMILAMLSEAPSHALTMSELAERTRFSPSRLSHAMRKLEGNDWVTRGRNPHCGRTIVATLTDAGHDALAAAAPGHVAEVRKLLLDRLTPQEAHALRDISIKILKGLGGCAQPSRDDNG